jgi:hypothetical protein
VEEAVFGGPAASPAATNANIFCKITWDHLEQYGEWNRGKDTHKPVASHAPYVQMARQGKRA